VVAPERRGYRRSARGGARACYFSAAGGLLHPGELIYVRARRRQDGATGVGPDDVHVALLMVRAGRPGSVNVRLVQDFGRSDEPRAEGHTATALPAAVTAEPPVPRRGRGRPPGSRSKKNGALGFHADH
jgi:hypothetical protein